MDIIEGNDDGDELIPWYILGATAILCAVVLLVMAALGPLGVGDLVHRTPQSGLYQLQGQDLADIFLIAPLLLIGGILQLLRRDSARYFLILTPVTLMYTGFSIGIGQEWTSYPGNAENYFWIFLSLIIGGLVLLIGTLPKFTGRDAPEFNRKGLAAFVGLTGLALLLFSLMWLGQINEVLSTGDLSDGSYSEAPTLFWTIRYLDLGISIPVGFLALFLMMSKPKKAYGLMMLFFGFFITMAVAVNAMALVQFLNDDAAIASMGPGVAIFPALGALAFVGLLYLVRHRIPRVGTLRA